MSLQANKLSILAARICRRGHEVGRGRFPGFFAELYGRDIDEADKEVQDILLSMRRLAKPGMADAGLSVAAPNGLQTIRSCKTKTLGSGAPKNSGSPFFNQFAEIHAKTVARDGDREDDSRRLPHAPRL